MKLETIKRNNKKNIIIGSMIVLSVVGCLTLTTSRAKYKSVQSLKLASGTVKYNAYDLHIVAIKTSEDGTNYNERAEIPTSGYTLNTEKSKCRIPTSTLVGEDAPVDESIPIEYKDGRVYIGITKKNTKCYLYFDKQNIEIVTTAFGNIEVKLDNPDFTIAATGTETEANNGIYKASDGMYGGNSYYWRGAATTNHVIFDNKCWRIVRINGDGSIRLIYNGAVQTKNTCKGNGTWDGSIAIRNTVYNSNRNDSSYVGWTYTIGNQRPSASVPQTSGIATTIKTSVENWYSSDITDKSKVAKGKFCNDRNTVNGTTWTHNANSYMYYAGEQRKNNPSYACSNGDIYELNVGLITADEVTFAGANGIATNKSYYLYNGQLYWTMTPSSWTGIYSEVFFVRGDTGGINGTNLDFNEPGTRPVINLRSDVTFSSGSDGTASKPYVVQ